MDLVITVLVMALVFGLCFLVDKGYSRLFRSKEQHRSGLSVRPNKRYGAFGLILAVLGLIGFFTGIAGGLYLIIAGIVVMLMGICLVVYYMSMGIYYDGDSFIYSTFGKRSVTYRFSDIKEQRLYVVTGGNMIVELHMKDGKAVSVQSAMAGALDFLNHAFSAWCRQTGRDEKNCDFHDPAAYRWFPDEEAA